MDNMAEVLTITPLPEREMEDILAYNSHCISVQRVMLL